MGFTKVGGKWINKDGDFGASSSVAADHEQDEHAADMDFQHEDLPEVHQDAGPTVGARYQEERMQNMSSFERLMVNEDLAKRDVMFKIGKPWREYRCKLWNEFYDPLISRSDLIKNVLAGLNTEQWVVFVDYRLRPSTVVLNKDIRKRQIILHTGGAMSLSRRRNNLKIETGKNIGRAEMWKITHKRKNGTYVNDEALEIGGGSDISSEEPTDVIFGKEHPVRVRGLSYGASDNGSGAPSPNQIIRSSSGSKTD
ncbi:uncharacterized protein [Phaseolus vulgaris]|uniref:uncharacterized protein n=1 Tax=Phaseolus vulgaris TaxID=3885 RepID=UPI0035CB10B0